MGLVALGKEKTLNKSENLKLDKQLCFPIYRAAKEIITKYGDFLTPINLTYTQYLVMMVLWEYETIDMKSLGEKLSLDSSTLTPLLNRLAEKNYIKKERDIKDSRLVIVKLDKEGKEIEEQARKIPEKLYSLVGLNAQEAENLKNILEKIIKTLSEDI